MPPDPLSSTDGAGRRWLLKGNFERKPVAFGPDLAVGEEVEVVPRERTRVLEEALESLVNAVGTAVPVHLVQFGPIRLIEDEWRAIENAAVAGSASLAAVAVEDGDSAADGGAPLPEMT